MFEIMLNEVAVAFRGTEIKIRIGESASASTKFVRMTKNRFDCRNEISQEKHANHI